MPTWLQMGDGSARERQAPPPPRTNSLFLLRARTPQNASKRVVLALTAASLPGEWAPKGTPGKGDTPEGIPRQGSRPKPRGDCTFPGQTNTISSRVGSGEPGAAARRPTTPGAVPQTRPHYGYCPRLEGVSSSPWQPRGKGLGSPATFL